MIADPSQLHRLDGRTALITGAGTGIGAAVAEAFAGAGADLVLVGRTAETLDAAAAGLRSTGRTIDCRVCDVTDTAAFRDLVAGMARLDILVNNAGTNIPEPMLDVTEEHLDRIMDLNVRALFLCSQVGIRKMLEAPDRARIGGSVIHVSSQMGHVGSPNRSVYCMSKHAVEGLTKAMALEFASHAIRVNTLCPTFTDTPLVRRIVDTQEKRDFLFSRIPMGRLASVAEIAAGALFLASPAAGMITGTHLIVDGGWTAQ